MEEKAIVKLGSDGKPTKCAKGDLSACGYKGGKICGKCGAMAVQVKEQAELKVVVDDDGDVMTCAKGVAPAKCGFTGGDSCKACGAVPELMTKGGTGMPADDGEDMGWAEDGESDREVRKTAKKRRMESMGVKSAPDDAYLCGFQQKMLMGTPCAACPGGCAPHGDLPTLIEVQGIAEHQFQGKVLDSGYSAAVDLFVVNLEAANGDVVEAIYDGVSAKNLGWRVLDSDVISFKSALDPVEVISRDEAADIAVKSIEGTVVAVDADLFEEHDAWAVEIDGLNGKSYDVFVGLDGKVLGWDEYELDTKADDSDDVDTKADDDATETDEDADDVETGEVADAEEKGGNYAGGKAPMPSIESVDDLKAAIDAYGDADNKLKARLNIIKAAAMLDAMDMIPDAWTTKAMPDEDDDVAEEDMAEGEAAEDDMAEEEAAESDDMAEDDMAEDDEDAKGSAKKGMRRKGGKGMAPVDGEIADGEEVVEDDDEDEEMGAKSDDAFLAALMEFELLAVETDEI